jgi:RNA polymerase primary sigma factor
VWWIRQSILQSLAEQARIVRLPLNKVGLTNKINKAYSQLEQEFEREPSAEELAELLDLQTEEVAASLSISSRHVSMDSPLSEGEDNTLIDIMHNPNADATDEELDHKQSLKTEIDRSLNTLTERQQEVIRYFFGIGVDHPLSLEDIGERFNLTRERVRQIKDKAISKLKSNTRCKLLKVYLG